MPDVTPNDEQVRAARECSEHARSAYFVDTWRSDCQEENEAFIAAKFATREAALAKERDALREYLHDICDAYEAWQKACDSPPGGDISDPEYRGPSKDECEAHDVEVTALWNAVGDAIQTACDARQEP